MHDLNEVALAALLHGSGMLLHGTGFDRAFLEELGYSEAICEASLEDGGLSDVLPITKIVRFAAKLASSHRGADESGGDDPSAPLNSILCFVGGGEASAGLRRAYPFVEYGGEGARDYMPRASGNGRHDGGCRELKESLARGFERLGEPGDVGSVMSLLERYGSYLGSGTAGDVSLYDHSRATAAIAVCISGHLADRGGEALSSEVENREAARYLFVRGDMSGVQEFIYTIASKGALRMLRARSFFLELLTEHAVAGILRRSGAPRTNVIFVGGGGFQLLLPNTKKSSEAVEAVEREMNEALANSFGRTLYLAMAKAPCDADGITGDGLGETLKSLGRGLSEQKARKFRESLPPLFDGEAEPKEESCAVCARDDAPLESRPPMGGGEEPEEPIKMCGACAMLDRASSKLVVHKYLSAGGRDFEISGVGYYFSNDARGALYALDGVGDDACLTGAAPLPAARYAMLDEERESRIMDFDKLSKESVGAPRLAVLRMDVDNLGDIFRSGLPEGMRTFGRYAALSRAFTTFFKMVVPRICEGRYDKSLRMFGGEGRRAAAVVYSGGDDLFIVGAWSDVLELAVDIRRAFREFACENPSITLSAGISIHKSGEPLYLMAEQAGAAEEAAKANGENGRKKDSVVLFHRGPDARRLEHPVPEALFWEEAEKVVELLGMVNEFRSADGKLPFPRGFTRLLMDVVDVYENEGHLSLPRLAYALARMEEGAKLKEDERWWRLKKELLKIQVVEKQLRPAAYWLDLAERGEER